MQNAKLYIVINIEAAEKALKSIKNKCGNDYPEAWREQDARLDDWGLSQDDYDRWRYHYLENDNSQICDKVLQEGVFWSYYL